MQFHNPNDTIHVPPQDIFEDLLDQVEKLQTQVDELKRLQYSNSSNARDVFQYGCELAGSQYLDLADHVVPKLHENDPLALMALCQIVLIEVNYNLIIGLSIKLLCTSLMLFL